MKNVGIIRSGRSGTIRRIRAAIAVALIAMIVASVSVAQVAPRIEECSKDQTVFIGEAAALHVSVTGTSPFRYQWGFRSSSLPDATNAILQISRVEFADARDDYWVTVENDYGLTVCPGMRLTVLPLSPVPGFIDTGFTGVPGFNQVAIVQSDGRIIAGGSPGVIRMMPDGGIDSTFANDGITGVASLVMQPDGKLIGLAGYGGLVEWRRRIFRLNVDGSRDYSYAPDFLGGNPFLLAAAFSAVGVQSNNKVVVVSRVLWAGSEDDHWLDPIIRRLNPNGSFDEAFHVSAVSCDGVQAIAVQPDDSILVGSHRVVRLLPNGALDPAFRTVELGPPRAACLVPGAVYCIAVQPDGRILVGGAFHTVGTNSISHVARLYADGTVDLSFSPPPFSGSEEVIVRTLAVQSDGQVLVGGNFEHLDGVPREGLARLNSDGTLDAQFITGMGLLDDEEDSVTSITLAGTDSALVGGTVDSYWGRKVDALFRIHLRTAPTDVDGDGLPDTWEGRYFGTHSSWSAPELDPDSDGTTNLDELLAGTDPTRATSVFKIDIARSQGRYAVQCPTVAGRVYHLEATAMSGSSDWQTIGGPKAGTGKVEEFVVPASATHHFYRIRIEGSVPGM